MHSSALYHSCFSVRDSVSKAVITFICGFKTNTSTVVRVYADLVKWWLVGSPPRSMTSLALGRVVSSARYVCMAFLRLPYNSGMLVVVVHSGIAE